jgi:tetratricopeptide (TPR) repeat protein
MRWLKKLLGKKKDPEQAAHRLARGVQLAMHERFEEALAMYESAITLDPDYALAYLNHALALQDLYNRASADLEADERRERLRQIRDSLERAVELDEELWVAWRSLAHVSNRLADFVGAEEAFVRIVSRAPEDFPHHEEAEQELKAVEQKAERQRTLERAIQLAVDPDAELEDLREVVEQVQPLLIHPETPDDAFWATGVLLRRLEDIEGAREMFEACVERAPRHLDARRELATIFMKAGEHREALEHSVEAYREDPSNPALICNVGVCHLTLGELEQAEEYLQMAHDLAPENEIVRRAREALTEARAGMEAPAG